MLVNGGADQKNWEGDAQLLRLGFQYSLTDALCTTGGQSQGHAHMKGGRDFAGTRVFQPVLLCKRLPSVTCRVAASFSAFLCSILDCSAAFSVGTMCLDRSHDSLKLRAQTLHYSRLDSRHQSLKLDVDQLIRCSGWITQELPQGRFAYWIWFLRHLNFQLSQVGLELAGRTLKGCIPLHGNGLFYRSSACMTCETIAALR